MNQILRACLIAPLPGIALIILAIWSGQRLPIYAVLFIAAWVMALSYATEITLFVPVMWLLGRLNQPRLTVPSAIGAVIAPIGMIVFARIVGVGEYPTPGQSLSLYSLAIPGSISGFMYGWLIRRNQPV